MASFQFRPPYLWEPENFIIVRVGRFMRFKDLFLELQECCAYRKSNSRILVVQSAQDRATDNAAGCLGSA